MTSLYDTLQAADCLSRELLLSPSTFKSTISAVFALLREQQISATVIAKLPRESIWYEALEQYRHSSHCGSSIYLLKPQTRRGAYSDAQNISTPVSASVVDTGLYAAVPQRSQVTDIWLPANNSLRRDFFVLVISAEFQSLLLAHRRAKDKSDKAATAAEPIAAESKASSETASADEQPSIKASLFGLHSFEPQDVKIGLEAITCCIEALQPQPSQTIVPVLEHWVQLLDQAGQWTPDVALLSNLWAQQISQQERLWQANIALKPQAELVDQIKRDSQTLTQTIELKDELFKRVGQELRAPLSSMKTALSILSSQNLKPAQRQRYIDMLTRECDRQSALIKSILELIHLEEMSDSTAMEPLNLIDIVPGVVSTYQPLAQEQGIMLAYTIPDDLPPVACLGPWLKQVVINLLDNGIKFTPQGGRVWVRAGAKAGLIQLEFQDTGIGIAPADIAMVFDRFYRGRSQADDATVGTGLGLSIVQQLLLKCGGTISVKSELGHGSTFHVSLPIYVEG
ncbi:MAG: ATP-binding protein [Elainellaceae cyanobacterium]